jgi:tetratricopeptide (TPR) repeat protein
LYTQIRGNESTAYLDRIYARDPFEERPLIWKAKLLLLAKRYEDAERVARAAIAVDPSDGEEGPGDRMRAYSVLADTLAARGDAANATLYRNAVEAIRESEHADEFRLAGAHTHAIAMYAKALDRFADAYCIQSRIAVELNARGNTLLAEEHYRRAYELMPTSFGRMESHCLGCENVFGGTTAQTIAEKVFGDLRKRMPGNPQVHYLSGYLREEQGRYAEALAEYRAAANLDKDYLNAWKRIAMLADKTDIPIAERDRVYLRLYELDPGHRHTYGDTDKVADWSALYTVAAKLRNQARRPTAALYPLRQSALTLGATGSSAASRFAGRRARYVLIETPGGVIARTELMQALTQLVAGPELVD